MYSTFGLLDMKSLYLAHIYSVPVPKKYIMWKVHSLEVHCTNMQFKIISIK